MSADRFRLYDEAALEPVIDGMARQAALLLDATPTVLLGMLRRHVEQTFKRQVVILLPHGEGLERQPHRRRRTCFDDLMVCSCTRHVQEALVMYPKPDFCDMSWLSCTRAQVARVGQAQLSPVGCVF